MGVSFRPARPEDAAELWRLNTAFNGPGDKAPAEMAANLAAPGGELTFVAQGDRGLVGFCCCQVKRSWCYREPAAELTELYVEPGFRRMGVAKGLLALAEEACARLGAEALTLLTGEDNGPARGFYESQGFSPSGEVHYEKELLREREVDGL